MGGDGFFGLITTIIDASNYNGNKFINFIINFLIFAPLIGITLFLLLKKRKKYVIGAGFLYLIGGVLLWLYKIIFFIYLILSDKMHTDYKKTYEDSIYLVSFLINLNTMYLHNT